MLYVNKSECMNIVLYVQLGYLLALSQGQAEKFKGRKQLDSIVDMEILICVEDRFGGI